LVSTAVEKKLIIPTEKSEAPEDVRVTCVRFGEGPTTKGEFPAASTAMAHTFPPVFLTVRKRNSALLAPITVPKAEFGLPAPVIVVTSSPEPSIST
jgi:hypothetical protein